MLIMYENTLILGSGANYFHFNTSATTGAPITLAGTPSLACRINGGTSATAGLTLSVDHGTITGLHRVALDVDNVTLALADGDVIEIYIAAGTADSVSLVGKLIARCSISDGSLLAQTSTDIQTAAAAALTAYDPPTHAEVTAAAAAVTLANGAHGGAAATITAKQIALANSDAGGVALDIVGSGTGNSHAIRAQSTNGQGFAIGSTNSYGMSVSGTGTDDLMIGGVSLNAATLMQIVADLTDAGRLDLLIDAIKAKTDSLTFTVAGQVDSNVQSINDVAVTGNGQVGTEFSVA